MLGIVPGIRVVRGPDWLREDQDGEENLVGTIAKVDDKAVSVVWDCGTTCHYRIECGCTNDLMVFDNAPAGWLIHLVLDIYI